MAALIDTFNRLETGVFDLVLRPLLFLGVPAALAIIACLAAMLMLWVYLRLSDQEGIRRAKSLIDADIIALSLYRGSPGVLPQILRRLFMRNLAYLRLSLRPLLILFVPFVIMLVQLQGRCAFRPLEIGETALVTVTVAGEDILKRPGAIVLEGDAGAAVDSPPVRIPALRKVVWRVRAIRNGTHVLKVTAGGKELTKQIVVGATRTVLSPSRTAQRFPGGLFRPGEPPLDPSVGVQTVTVAYPEVRLGPGGLHLHWLVWFLLVLAAATLGMKGILGVSL